MSNPKAKIVRCYAFTLDGGHGGHISVTDDGRAVLVHAIRPDNRIEFEVFSRSADETGEMQARTYVHENIDAEAEFFEEPFLGLATWLLENT
jgi:hypothetical protein